MIVVLIVIVFLLVLALTIGAVYVFCEDNAKRKQSIIVKAYSDKVNAIEIASQAQISALQSRVQMEREAFADYKIKYPMKAKYKIGTEVFVNILGRTQKGKIVAVSFMEASVDYSIDCSGIVLNGLKEDQITRNETDLGN